MTRDWRLTSRYAQFKHTTPSLRPLRPSMMRRHCHFDRAGWILHLRTLTLTLSATAAVSGFPFYWHGVGIEPESSALVLFHVLGLWDVDFGFPCLRDLRVVWFSDTCRQHQTTRTRARSERGVADDIDLGGARVVAFYLAVHADEGGAVDVGVWGTEDLGRVSFICLGDGVGLGGICLVW